MGKKTEGFIPSDELPQNFYIFSHLCDIYLNMRRTIKIPVQFPKEEVLPLLETCNSIYNLYIEWAFASRSYNKNKAHKDLYHILRKKFPNVPSALLQSVRDMALESVKALKFKFKPSKSNTSGIRFDKRCCSIRGNLLSISTLNKRQKTLLSIPKYFQDIFDSWKFTGLQLTYNKQKDQIFVSLNYEKPDPSFQDGDVLGIDRGLKNIVYCSNSYKVSGKKRNRIKRKRAFQRKTLQAKGTRSAKRRLAALRQKEKRFSLNENHIISKDLISLPFQVFVLEKLSTQKNSKNRKKKGKRFNRRISNWSYYQLELFLMYKAIASRKCVHFVDARYTSQKCNACGYIDKRNRNLEEFRCRKCGHSDHADLNAAKNIRDLYLTNPIPSGQAEKVNQPNALPKIIKDDYGDGVSGEASPLRS